MKIASSILAPAILSVRKVGSSNSLSQKLITCTKHLVRNSSFVCGFSENCITARLQIKGVIRTRGLEIHASKFALTCKPKSSKWQLLAYSNNSNRMTSMKCICITTGPSSDNKNMMRRPQNFKIKSWRKCF